VLAIPLPVRLIGGILVALVMAFAPNVVDRTTSMLIVLSGILGLVILLGPPILKLIRPSVHVTRPKLRVEAPPIVKEWRAWRGTKGKADAGQDLLPPRDVATPEPTVHQWGQGGVEVTPRTNAGPNVDEPTYEGSAKTMRAVRQLMELQKQAEQYRDDDPELGLSYICPQCGHRTFTIDGAVAMLNHVDRHHPTEPLPSKPEQPANSPSTTHPTSAPVATPTVADLSDVTPQYLWALFEERRDIDARGDLEPFLGGRMTVSGPVGDVSMLGTFAVRVTFPYGIFPHHIYMDFGMDWLDRLRPVAKGTQITVRGTLTDASPIDLHLKDCEIVRLGPWPNGHR
jgi:hypothetical protein